MENNRIEIERNIARYKSIVKCEAIIMILAYSIPGLFIFIIAGFSGLIGFTVFFFFLPLLGYAGIKVSKSSNISTAEVYKTILFGISATSGGSSVCCLIGFLIFFIYLYNFECTKEMYDTCGTYKGIFAFFMFLCGFFGICSIVIFSMFSIFSCHAKKFHELLLARESASLPSMANQPSAYQYIPLQESTAHTFRVQPPPANQYIPMQEMSQRVI
ncbi:unnamed protein product [Blepharisma stoltei]|uniref:Uncharacterized protein n=1 Tax=Blepharisma stoltei TaxID=1481888 RepID=A0AAU9J750_9CILI|nr:unnamed protein product [Blepharisma stoltei]